ncbi:MAG: MFS transporter [Halioglobus sp.]
MQDKTTSSTTLQSAPDVDTSHRSAFLEPLYRRYFPQACFSTLGSWLLRFLFGWSAWELTHSAWWVGVVAGVMLLPTFLLSPVFGIVSDRINPRKGLVVTLALHGVIAAVAAAISAMGALDVRWLVILAASMGAVTSAHTPIRLALVPLMVSRRALPSAIGLSAMVFNAARILGPAVGAVVVARYSVTAAFMLSVVMFCIALPILMSIRIERHASLRKPSSFRKELVGGMRYAAEHPVIRFVLGLTLINGLLGRTLLELLPAFSGQLLDGRAQTLAILSGAGGAGSILGGLIVSRQGGSDVRLLRLVMVCLLLASVCLLSVQWLSGLSAFVLLIFVLSMITTMVGTSSQALAQLLVDEQFRGRVLSLWTVLAMGAPAVGAMLIGALAQQFGFPAVTLCAGLLAMLLLMPMGYRMWQREPS